MALETKNEIVKSVTPSNVLSIEKDWPYRLLGSLAVLLVIVSAVLIILTLKNDLVNKRLVELKEDIYVWAGEQGLTLDDMIVSGRNRTTKEELESAINLKRGDNMLKIDVYAIKENLEKLPWIRRVKVRRSFMPNVLLVDVEEKEVSAIWQLSEKFYPIDAEGKVIEANFRSSAPVLLIVGAGAPEHLTELLSAIKDEDKDYYKRIKVANFISGRRWNLILDDIVEGITVKLPEDNIAQAWKKLLKLNSTKGILKRKLTIIDLRLDDKVVVKLRKSSAEKAPQLNKAKESKT